MAKQMNKEAWKEAKIWKTEAKYFTWLRGQLRRVWAKWPVKNEFKKSKLVPVFAGCGVTDKRVKSVGQCVFCNKWHPNSSLQIDHIDDIGYFGRTPDTVGEWLFRSLCGGENMQLVCVECHKVKSYADRLGVSFEEAKIKKQVIAFSKLTDEMQKSILSERGSIPVLTKAGRKKQYEGLLNLE